MNTTDARLQSLTITNFRSIRQSAPIDLDAPIVLLHGQNGAGKTTVMSAIELALNGKIAGLESADREHLVHRGAKTAIVELSTSLGPATLSTSGGKVEGKALLNDTDARFFSERCYLTQRALGRLLEIYASAPPKTDSPLTRFVKDLLGLDELDALIDGLEPVKDIRLVKKLVPAYSEALENTSAERDRIAAIRTRLQTAVAESADTRRRLTKSLNALKAPATADSTQDTKTIARWLASTDADSELEQLETAAREITRARSRSEIIAKELRASRAALASEDASAARDAADAWWASSGSELEAILDEIRKDIPTLIAAAATEPSSAHQSALEQINNETKRIKDRLTADASTAAAIKKLEGTIRTVAKRLEKIDQQFAAGGDTVGGRDLATALAALVPHLHGEDCPICGRDYGEISNQSLASHIAEEVSKLSAHAEHLQELAAARLEAVSATTAASERRETLEAQRLDDESLAELNAQLARFSKFKTQLNRLSAGVGDGAAIVARATEAERASAVAQRNDRASADLARSLELLCDSLHLKAPRTTSETPTQTLTRLEAHVKPKIAQFTGHARKREAALTQLSELEALMGEQLTLEAELDDGESRSAETRKAIKALQTRRATLKRLREEGQSSRTQIIREVFNSSLNRMWRDLFVRLAPDELFVPAFLVPSTGARTVTANLTTTHRDRKPGGSPEAMLSAGNLNTAALTLFLALHLTARPALPWLLLDDPVQSMDEVHVAQFAAVLRTLTRQHGKRVVIAVHERALFDYLALELAPARPEDSLITVEMTRSPSGVSTLVPVRHGYEVDPVLAAA
jgi:DNA repair protein SbcC/Rad50